MKSLLSIPILVFSFVLFTSCGSFTPFSSGSDSGPVSKEIGSEGGTIITPDGRLTLSIPAGALGNTETITIEEITAGQLGAEFDAIADDPGINKAYELGPDGLDFVLPITVQFNSDQSVSRKSTDTSESVSMNVELLLTSENGVATGLDSLRMSADEGTRKITLAGELDHFTPLVSTHPLAPGIFEVRGVPGKMYVGGRFTADVSFDSGQYGHRSPDYKDLSGEPIHPRFIVERNIPAFGGFFDARIERVEYYDLEPSVFDLDNKNEIINVTVSSNDFEYECTAVGTGVYSGRLRVKIPEIQSSSDHLDTWIYFPPVSKSIECIEPEEDEQESITEDREEEEESLLTEMEGDTSTLEGRVTSEDGEGIAGVIVQMKWDNELIYRETDESGSYTFDNAPAGNVEVSISLAECDENPREVFVKHDETTRADFVCDLDEDEEEEEVANETMQEGIDGFVQEKWSLSGGIGLTTTGTFDDRVGNQPGIVDYDVDGSSTQFHFFGERTINRVLNRRPFNFGPPRKFSFSVGADVSYRQIGFKQMWVQGNGLPDHTMGRVNIYTLGAYTQLQLPDVGKLWDMGFRPFLILGGGIIWNNGKFTLIFTDQTDESFSRNHRTAFPRIAIGFDVSLNEWFELRTSLNTIQGVGADSYWGGHISLIYNLCRNRNMDIK